MIEPITLRGYDLIIEEFNFLKDELKPKVNTEKRVAAELGDRSENAEYHAAKEKLRHIDKRLFFLNDLIKKLKIVDPSSLNHTSVNFGSTITLEDLDTQKELTYTICGSVESEVENNLISFHAPLTKAMLGKKVGDDFKITLPSSKKEYEIIDIKYIPIYDLKQHIKTKEDFVIH